VTYHVVSALQASRSILWRQAAPLCTLTRRAASTDQVVVGVLGLEHPRDVLQVVGVDLLGAPPGEGHGDDALRDVRQVEFVPLLHAESRDFLFEKKTPKAETQGDSGPSAASHHQKQTLPHSIFGGQSPRL